MIHTHEDRVIFAKKLLLTCVRGPISYEGNFEEAAFRAGLNLPSSNGFQLSKVHLLGLLLGSCLSHLLW